MNYSPRPHLSIDGWPLRRTSAALVNTWLINSELQKSQGEMWNMRRSTSLNEIRPSSSAHVRSGALWKTQFAMKICINTRDVSHEVGLVVNPDSNWGKLNSFWLRLKFRTKPCRRLCSGLSALIRLEKLVYMWGGFSSKWKQTQHLSRTHLCVLALTRLVLSSHKIPGMWIFAVQHYAALKK